VRIRTRFRNRFTVVEHRHPDGVTTLRWERDVHQSFQQFWRELLLQRREHKLRAEPYRITQRIVDGDKG
jgi:hypothetical protein